MEILKVQDMYEIQVAKFFYRLYHNLLPCPLTQALQFEQHHHYNTRHMVINYYNVQNLRIVGPIIWNSIPEKIKSINTLSGFKAKLKKHLISKYSET